MVKRILKLTKKAPKYPGLTDTGPEDSDTKDEQEPALKRKQRQPKKAPKTPEFVDTDSDDSGNSDTEDTLRALGFPTTGDIQRLRNLRAG